jgi:DNA-binding transcriptional LysR family regulator
MMYNPQLDTFLCVVEAGSFSKAAEQLYISAPNRSIRLRQVLV